MIKKLYEAYATGKIPENHFSELLTGYDTEQKTLDGEIERLQAEIDRYNTDSVRADKFIELVKRHTEFTEFSASLLNEFVEKIIVHEATKVNGVREQEVEIYLNFIGKFDLPEQEEQPEETPVRKSRKARHNLCLFRGQSGDCAGVGGRRRGPAAYRQPDHVQRRKGSDTKLPFQQKGDHGLWHSLVRVREEYLLSSYHSFLMDRLMRSSSIP